MYCSKCGNEILDNSEFCNKCGGKIQKDISVTINANSNLESVIPSEPQQQTKNIFPKVKKLVFKHKIFTIIITIIVLFCAVGLPLISTNMLSAEEKLAVTNVQDLKNTLKDPDSLKLYDDVLVIWHTDDYYSYINYGAKNSYGAMDRDTAMYKGNTYIGTFTDVNNIKLATPKTNDLILLQTQMPYLSYDLYLKTLNAGDQKAADKQKGTDKYTLIHSSKILSHLK
jgi:uncharacterized membrane protein YvbJ